MQYFLPEWAVLILMILLTFFSVLPGMGCGSHSLSRLENVTQSGPAEVFLSLWLFNNAQAACVFPSIVLV